MTHAKCDWLTANSRLIPPTDRSSLKLSNYTSRNTSARRKFPAEPRELWNPRDGNTRLRVSVGKRLIICAVFPTAITRPQLSITRMRCNHGISSWRAKSARKSAISIVGLYFPAARGLCIEVQAEENWLRELRYIITEMCHWSRNS